MNQTTQVTQSTPSSTPNSTSAQASATPLSSRGSDDQLIVFDNVSKFYGEVLGVNRVSLTVEPGITSLVGPNGSGKTTLMNLVTGLLQPTRGTVRVHGIGTDDPERLMRRIGYATQFDSFPRGMTGRSFVVSFLRLHGYPRAEAARLGNEAIERVGLTDAAGRKVAGYSKGMRQRIRLAQAIAHKPRVLILDEPLNGLDPMARADVIGLFQELADEGFHVVVSSHILHEVDLISDRVVILNNGYVVADGDIRGVRREMSKHPMQILIRADRPTELASKLFTLDGVVEAKLLAERQELLIRTRDADSFYLSLNQVVLDEGFKVEAVMPADENVQAVYDYLIGGNGGSL